MYYKEKYKGSKVDFSIGFISGIRIEFKNNSKIKLFDNISFIDKDNDNYGEIIGKVKKEKFFSNGSFLVYEPTKELSIKTYFEISDKIENVVRAIRFMKNDECEYIYHLDFYNNLPYNPSINLDKKNFRGNMTKVEKKDFKKLEELFKKLEKLKLQDFSEYNRLKNSINFYDRACDERSHLSSLINFFISLESLFSDDEKSEIAYKIRLRTAYLNYPEKNKEKERKELFDLVKEGYNMRSLFLHGGDIGSNKKIKEKNSYSYFEEYIPKIRAIVGNTIKKILLNNYHYDFFSKDRGSKAESIVRHLDLKR